MNELLFGLCVSGVAFGVFVGLRGVFREDAADAALAAVIIGAFGSTLYGGLT